MKIIALVFFLQLSKAVVIRSHPLAPKFIVKVSDISG